MDDTTPNGVPSLYSLNMSPTAFKSAINKACETAVNNALNGLQEPIDSVVTTKVAAQRDIEASIQAATRDEEEL
ncbi:unnamed protein product [Fusarium fujikuroi]|uniref:Uncharacterized protein n=1 Tax=Fusarium fujikuroi TaxID=5127 RepID=A0A9Q9RF30_FUSFU|nr:unnamed protein product [Fusarium fujikuroi]VTT79464.1 unnamed protein product [Fusarium fujikuroi]VZH88865.1 unnamed protein product [Fusarium fujikuroi]